METWSAAKTETFWTGNPIHRKKPDPLRFINQFRRNLSKKRNVKNQGDFRHGEGDFCYFSIQSSSFFFHKKKQNIFKDWILKIQDLFVTLWPLLKPEHEWLHSGPKLPNSSFHLRLRDPAHHTLLLCKSLGTRRCKIHSAVTIVPWLFTLRFLIPLTPVES